jgi:hypothetical protein
MQRILATLGRVDKLTASGGVDVILKSSNRFANNVRVLEGYRQGNMEGGLRPIGPDLVLGRLGQELGLDRGVEQAVAGASFRVSGKSGDLTYGSPSSRG